MRVTVFTAERRLAPAASSETASSSRRIPVSCIIVKESRTERPRGSQRGYPDHGVADGYQLNGYPDHYNQAFAFSAIFYPASCGPSLRAAFRSKQPAEEVSLSCLACHAFSLMHEAYFASSPFRLIGLKPFSAYRPVLCRNDFLHHQRTLQSSPRRRR